MVRAGTRSNFIHGLLLWWDNWGAPLSVNLPAMADVQNVEHVAQIIHDDPVVPDAKPPESRAAEFCRVVREAVRVAGDRSEEHTSELQSLMRISYAVFCLKKKNITIQ